SRGNLSLALTPITDYLTLDLIQKFLNDYPNITLQVHEMSQSDVEEAVLRDMVNVGVAFSDENSLTSARTELERISLRTEHLILASGKNESSAPIDSLATLRVELDRYPLALLGSRYEMRRKIDSYFATNNLAPQITLESNSLGFLIELVKRGRLRTILPRSIVSFQEGLTEIPFEPGLPTHNVTLILSKSTYRSRATDCFLRYALNPPFYQKS
ncbi:MAG: LysR substrate-binding domain-containing protein, partial [Gammaproteobacteria bacterium]